MKNIKNILGMGAFMLLALWLYLRVQRKVIGILTLPTAVLSELMKTESV